MAFKASHVVVGDIDINKVKNQSSTLPPLPPIDTPSSLELTDKELELLLLTIKNGLFKGEYVEILYNLTLKLQTHLISLRGKNNNP
jgi:hypothetical protein